MPALALRTDDIALPESDLFSVTLARPADQCYRLFCNVERIPEWLPVVRSALVIQRDKHTKRAVEVAFLARLERATIGYTVRYRYQPDARKVSWSTRAESSICVRGIAEFVPLGDRACQMWYGIDLDLGGAIAGFVDPLFDGHAASAALNDFRDFVTRAD